MGSISKARIYIDMDDTLCHFVRAHSVAITKNPSILYPQSQYGFFTGLEPLEDAIDTVNRLRADYEVHILSRPSVKNPLCYTEKRVWVEQHFDLEMCENLILCCNKGLLKGDILIDDMVWSDFEGEQIVFGQHPFEDWKKVYDYITEKYK